MGIYDRDYMRESGGGDGSEFIVKLLKLLLLAMVLFAVVRFPIPVFVKFPLMFLFCFLIYRTIVR
jgi:hypothetical protein